MVENKKIALLFFSRTATLEGREKALCSRISTPKNQRMAAALICHTEQVLSRSGLPVFHIHEGLQRGQTFGERLANAYQSIFDLGYDGVIAVGNDTPEIDRIDWRKLSGQLTDGRCVIGPTCRQGAYLIGITAELFDKQTFQELPWRSRQLLASLVQYCSDTASALVLDRMRDVNGRSDLMRVLRNSYVDRDFKKLIRDVLFPVNSIFRNTVPLRKSRLYLLGNAHFRAPPLLLY